MMVVAAENQLYKHVVEVTREYLGPAADRFISRQVANHLQKTPDDLEPADLGQLIDWLKLSMAFLTKDERLIEDYVSELQAIDRPVPSGNKKAVKYGRQKTRS